MAKIFFIISAFAPFLFPQEQYSKTDFKSFERLIGEWHTVDFQWYAEEIWERTNDSTLNAVSFIIEDEDTVSYETISLEYRGGKIHYIPAVRDQNEGGPIYFTLIELGDKAVFENKDHDFPQRIIYDISEDKLEAVVQGEENGGNRSIIFNFDRKK